MIRSLTTAALVTATVAMLSVGCAAAPEELEGQDTASQAEGSEDDEVKVAVDTSESTSPKGGVNCQCPVGQQYEDGLCYTPCASGYKGVGPVCWETTCSAGFTDTGAFCHRDSKIISANTSKCPWYDKCGIALKKGCSTCPAGYSNDGCTCRRDAYIYAKRTYTRGEGIVPVCSTY